MKPETHLRDPTTLFCFVSRHFHFKGTFTAPKCSTASLIMTFLFFLQVQKESTSNQTLHGPSDIQRADPVSEEVRQLQRRENNKGKQRILAPSLVPKDSSHLSPSLFILYFLPLLLFLQDVGYPEFLNIRPYMSQSSGDPVMYGLYAVLVHSGYSCHAGHYYCYVKVR